MQPFKYKPKVNSGDLRQRVDVHGDVKFKNELGESSWKFQKIKTVWAEVVPQTAALQRQQAETMLTNVTHKIIVRYDVGQDITKDMQIHFRGHRFEIKYVLNPYFKNETIEIFCQELMD